MNTNDWFCFTNLMEKSEGYYIDKKSLVYPKDWFSIANDVVDLIYHYVHLKKDTSRIEFSLDDNFIRKYNLPFDKLHIYVYRDHQPGKFLSNYMYTEIDGYRTFMIDLYFLNNQLLTGYFMKYMISHCILMEMNNCFNRDIYEQED